MKRPQESTCNSKGLNRVYIKISVSFSKVSMIYSYITGIPTEKLLISLELANSNF